MSLPVSKPAIRGTTDKARMLGFDEAAGCLADYGFQTPRELECAPARGTVVNKRAVVRHIWSMLRRAPDPWDYPAVSRGVAALRSLGDLALAEDCIWDWRDLTGTLAYHCTAAGFAYSNKSGAIS